ncbi:MAG: hypothetical protein V4514_07420 [Pseudomonadota bacterium]|nr:hypothetical protein [Phenylobacterium sp.]
MLPAEMKAANSIVYGRHAAGLTPPALVSPTMTACFAACRL